MRLYIPSMQTLFAALDKNNWPYVVIRGFHDLKDDYPRYGTKRDIDLLVDAAAIKYLNEQYSAVSRRRGVKCDFYTTSSRPETDYCGAPYFPLSLAASMLARRELWHGRFYIPSPDDRFYSLIYHIAYQKAELSGFDFSDPERGRSTKYHPELQEICRQSGQQSDYTLKGMHDVLEKSGLGIDYHVLSAYIKNNFNRGRKSYFLGWVCNRWPGEMNLFVIRQCAFRHDKAEYILAEIEKRYDVLAVKDIPWFTRTLKARHMRGGKWRRGGKPCRAVVVFDPEPENPTRAEIDVHKHVFNRKQFFKPALREWFVTNTGARASDNPLHSTDNEAEALGHLGLFFNEQEEMDILEKLTIARARIN